jgi:hypothetical protein
MSFCVAPIGAPHTDLARALEHRREHDVHDPDPAHDERDRRDRTEDDVEDRARALLLLQEQFRYGDLEVDHLVVPAREHPLQQLRDGRNLVRTPAPAR